MSEPGGQARLALLVALTMTAFAANSVLNRLGLASGSAGPLAFAALRLVSGAACLAVLVAASGRPARLLAALSLPKAAALLAYMAGFSLAYLSLDAGLGALILFGGVQLTMFAGALTLGETVTRRRGLGAAVALGGLVWLLWPAGDAAVPVTGALAMLAAAVGWGLYSLMGRGVADPLAVTGSAFALAAVPMVALAAVAWDGMTPVGAALAVISGAVTSGLGYALWYSLLPRLAASTAAVAQLTVPPIAIAGGTLLLAEAPSGRFLLATVVVLGGVLLALVKPRAPRD